MASKAKPTGTRRNSTRATKPATIDLDAKEVKAETASKTAAEDKAQNFGRPNNTQPSSPEKETKASSATKPEASKASVPSSKTDAKTTEEKPTPNKKPETAAKPSPQKSSGSFFGKLTSAFFGGVAALVGFGAIGLWEGARELPIIGTFYGGTQQSATTDTNVIGALQAEIEALKQSSSNASVNLNPINEKLAALEKSISEVSVNANSSSALDEKLAKLEEGFAGVNNSIAEITASAADGSNTSPVALSAAISSLDGRLETLEADLGTVANTITKNPTLDTLSSSVGSLETQVQNIAKSVTTLEKSAQENSQTLSGLTEQSETLQDTVASVKASEKVAKSVAVNALATALKNDDALSLPISSVKALIGETIETKRLEELNASGISSRVALVSDLEKIINTVQNPNAPSKDGSITDRFWANAQNMVSFRTSGPQEGETPLAILSRVKASVDSGNLTSAQAEWETLPEDIRKSGAGWEANLNARIEAFALQNALNQKLTAEAG